MPDGRDEAAEAIDDAINRTGARRGRCRYGTRTNGWGYVEKQIDFDIDE